MAMNRRKFVEELEEPQGAIMDLGQRKDDLLKWSPVVVEAHGGLTDEEGMSRRPRGRSPR